jgi:N-acetylmuramoyl-L-alanine amidase
LQNERMKLYVLYEKDYQKKYDGFDPNSPEANIIFSLYQETYLHQSLHFASIVQDEIKKKGRQTRGMKQAGFIVLYRTYMPAILLETGFLSNKTEERLLSSKEGQDEMAESVFNAFRSYKKLVESDDSEKLTETPPKENRTTEKAKPDTLAIKEIKDTVSKGKIDSAALYKPKDTVTINKTVVKTAQVIENKTEKIKSEYYFTVQILLSPDKLEPGNDKFREVKGAEEHFIDTVYKYTVGRFTSFNEAVARQGELRKQGFGDAFIVAYKNGKRIPVPEARKALK